MGHTAMTKCTGHQVEFRCCRVVHYRSVQPILVGGLIRPENIERVCTECPAPAHGVEVHCCVCTMPIRWAVSLEDGTMHYGAR